MPLDKEKISFQEMYDSLHEKAVKFKTDEVKGHSHLGTHDADGNGETIKTNGKGKDHVHKVTDGEIQPSGGHIHKLMGMKESADLMEGTANEPGRLELIQGGKTVIIFFDAGKGRSLLIKLDAKAWEKYKKGEKVKADGASLGIWESERRPDGEELTEAKKAIVLKSPLKGSVNGRDALQPYRAVIYQEKGKWLFAVEQAFDGKFTKNSRLPGWHLSDLVDHGDFIYIDMGQGWGVTGIQAAVKEALKHI